jgi:hypothetical protein
MLRVAFRFLAALVVAFPLNSAAQTPNDLNGSWTLDRPASTFGPGDWGAETIDIRMTPEQVMVARSFEHAEGPAVPAVWELPLDGSTLPPPRDKGSAQFVNGKLQITFQRLNEVVTYLYTVEGNTLSIERTIQTQSGAKPDFTHTMIYHRAKV